MEPQNLDNFLGPGLEIREKKNAKERAAQRALMGSPE